MTQQLFRKPPPSHMGPAVVKAPPPLLTTHDAKVDALRLKTTLFHLQDEAEMDISEEVLRDFSWSRNSTYYTVKMMEFRQRRQNELKRHRLITRGPAGDCKARMAYNKEEAKNQPRSKAPPPMWTESNSSKSLAVDSQESTARRDERGQK